MSRARGGASAPDEERRALGVDWCNGSWLGVKRVHGTVELAPETGIQELVEAHHEDVDRVLVDVPIGLFSVADRDERADGEELVRDCDSLARSILGARHSSVFNPPAREAIEKAADGEEPYETVSETNRDVTGKGLQQQAYHIAPCIYEVDQLLRDDPDPDMDVDEPSETVLEAHPEVCFQALATDPERADDEQGLEHSKKTVAGLAERLEALDGHVEDAWREFGTLCETVRDEHPERDVDVDDLLDAMALAVTGCAPDGRLQHLPCENPPEDDCDLPMQMVYWRSEPFDVARE